MKRFIWVIGVLFLVGCAQARPTPATPTQTETLPLSTAVVSTVTAAPILVPTATPERTPTLMVTPSITPTQTPPASPTPGASGPDEVTPGINPLTGLPVRDVETLKLPPALISVTNSPIAARPQMGLADAAWIFELWIGEGVSRFLALFYGNLPQTGLDGGEPVIGPIRSGRLPYELLRRQYNGFMVMTYASSWVLPELNFYHNVINESLLSDINGARITTADVRDIAAEFKVTLGEPNLPGLRFDPRIPAGGAPAPKIWLPWSFNSQVWWRFDDDAGMYRRWQDEENGGQTFVQATDRLTGDPLGASNVVILFANHTEIRDRLIDIDLENISKAPALVFRDGQVFKAFWATANDDYERKTGKLRPVRLMDTEGNAFPLKPGQTWAEIVTTATLVYEAPDTMDFHRLATQEKAGSGVWVVRFYPPLPPAD